VHGRHDSLLPHLPPRKPKARRAPAAVNAWIDGLDSTLLKIIESPSDPPVR